jgi:hypothetical protein
MITPDSVRGIIEVKTKLDKISELEKITNKLAGNLEFIDNDYCYRGKNNIFV